MHLNLTPPLLFSLSLFLSPISNLHRKLKKQSIHTAQRNATDLRSKPQCASLISWSEVTLSLSLSLSLCFFSDFKLIENFTRFIMVLNRYQSFFFNIYMDLSAPFMVSIAFSHYVLNEWSLLSILFSVSDFGFGFGIWSAVFI